jgi:hypothetical protein
MGAQNGRGSIVFGFFQQNNGRFILHNTPWYYGFEKALRKH